MQKLFFMGCLLLSALGFSQEIIGDWNALLEVGGQELPLVFHISKTDSGYDTMLDSPKQGAFGLKANTTTFKNDTLTITLPNLSIVYEGTLTPEKTIAGTFKQGGIAFPLDLTQGEAKATAMNRPQEPKAPYPYHSEDVTFTNNEAGITLAATLTMPEVAPKDDAQYPAVILISGSGPQNRDEELLGHKPFLVLADHLTRNGFAVLRYDDRGTAQSTGDHSTATSADFATDAQAAFKYLLTRKEINPQKIGFAGHSEGGFIAPMVAAKNKEVAFLVLLAGTGTPGDEILSEQGYLIGKAQGMSEEVLQKNQVGSKALFDIIKEHKDQPGIAKEKAINYLTKAITENPDMLPEGAEVEKLVKQQINQLTTPWFMYFLSTPPAPFLEQVDCPVYAINGSLDLQVPSKSNLEAIEKYVKKGGNEDVTTQEFANLNHLFQHTETGDPAEYATIEETFAPEALEAVSNWLKEKTK